MNTAEILDVLKSRYSCVSEPLPRDNDPRYLSRLWVFSNKQHSASFSKMMVDLNFIDTQMIKEKIISALSALGFRESHVLVQFWSPVIVGNRCLLMTLDQPFGIGVVDEALYLYRLESEQRMFVVDGEHREELGPPGRVYCQKLSEWSVDVHTLQTRKFVQDLDACYKIHGYINLPVFEPDSGCCVGVLELITSSSYVDYAFEVLEVSRALKEQNLKSPNVFEDPSIHFADERRRHELAGISKVLKTVCDILSIPLAQSWALSGYSSVVANSGNLEQSCSSFNKSCIGKVCMSTSGLPFYIRDLRMWEFHKACRERHLEKSQGVVGRSLSSCGTWFCRDVTELDEDDYPLVLFARMCGLTSCLAIYMKSLELDVEYVIEFFLPTHGAGEADLQKLMETVNEQIKNASFMQLDTMSAPQVIGGTPFNWNLESSPLPITLLTVLEVPQESGNIEHEPFVSVAVGTSHNVVPYLEKGMTQRKRKRSERVISFKEIDNFTGKPNDEVAAIINDNVSKLGHRSTHQQEQTNLPVGRAQPKTTITANMVENLTVKATYKVNTVKFPFILSDGMVKLVELIATRFQLSLGSFKLNYKDEDGDMILITCDSDLMGSVGDSRQQVNPTVLRLLVLPVVHQCPDT
ncbi:NIN-like protein [Tanacetum coccineum]